jgi:hypothetical protein
MADRMTSPSIVETPDLVSVLQRVFAAPRGSAEESAAWSDLVPMLQRPAPRSISELVRVRPCTPAVEARLRKYNPRGVEMGAIPRGWHPHPRINRLMMDLMPVRAFVAKFGRAAYRAIPRHILWRQGHRKAVPHLYVENLP